MRFSEDRAPLEMTKSSSRTVTLVCPNCRIARSVSVNCHGVICGNCNKYFRVSESLPKDQAEGNISVSLIDQEFVKIKEESEKKAYNWIEERKKQGRYGKKIHEPRGN